MNNIGNQSTERDKSVVQAIHSAVQGRARYKVNGLHDSESLCTYLEFRMLNSKGIRKVSASPVTGNILVVFTPSHSYGDIAALIEKIVFQYSKRRRKNYAGENSAINSSQEQSKKSAISTQKLQKLMTSA